MSAYVGRRLIGLAVNMLLISFFLFFTLRFLPGDPTPDQDAAPVPPRVGLVVSGAVGPAVTRTLVKRRLRHLAREQLDALPGGSLLVLRAQPGAAGAAYAELGAELTRCLSTCLRKAAR